MSPRYLSFMVGRGGRGAALTTILSRMSALWPGPYLLERPQWAQPGRTLRRNCLLQQGSGTHVQCSCQLLHNHNSRIACTPLDVADVGTVDASSVGELFLTPASFFTGLSQVGAEALPDVHACSSYDVSIIGLQTMSDMAS